MSRPRQFQKGFSVRFSALDATFVLYYAWKYKRDKVDVIRSMVNAYVNADKRFDPDEYLAFVKKELKATLSDGDDPEVLDEMRRVAKAYAERRKGEG